MLEEYFDDDLDEHGQGVSMDQISDAEKKLSLKFAKDHKKFLLKYDYADLPGHTIFGISPPTNLHLSETIIENTKFYKEKQKWPGIEDWYIISDDGFGNPIGINPEGKVWLSDHNAGFEQVKLADSFEEFLYKILTDTLYE